MKPGDFISIGEDEITKIRFYTDPKCDNWVNVMGTPLFLITGMSSDKFGHGTYKLLGGNRTFWMYAGDLPFIRYKVLS